MYVMPRCTFAQAKGIKGVCIEETDVQYKMKSRGIDIIIRGGVLTQ